MKFGSRPCVLQLRTAYNMSSKANTLTFSSALLAMGDLCPGQILGGGFAMRSLRLLCDTTMYNGYVAVYTGGSESLARFALETIYSG